MLDEPLVGLIIMTSAVFIIIILPVLIYYAYSSDRKKSMNKEIRYAEIIDSSHIATSRTAGMSAFGRGLVGGAILGPLGMAAGVASASKKTSTEDKTTFLIIYNDGTQKVETVSNTSYKYKIYINKIYDSRMNLPAYEDDFSISDEIQKAKALYDEGLITFDEFQKIKDRIINN